MYIYKLNIIGLAVTPLIDNCGWESIVIVATYVVILLINSKLYYVLISCVCYVLMTIFVFLTLKLSSYTQNIAQHAVDKVIEPGIALFYNNITIMILYDLNF